MARLVHSDIVFPARVASWAEARISAALPDLAVEIGALRLGLEEDSFLPRLGLSDVVLRVGGNDGARLALPAVAATLDLGALRGGALRPASVAIEGAEVALVRAPDGTLDVALSSGGAGQGGLAAQGNLADVLETVEQMLDTAQLRGLQSIAVTGLRVTLDDRRAARFWVFEDGRLELASSGGAINGALTVGLDVPGAPGALARVAFASPSGSPSLSLTARIENVPARDLADEVPQLDWLRLLDAPISGDMFARVSDSGRLETLRAALEVGAGQLSTGDDGRQGRFSSARLGIDYEEESGRLRLTEVAIDAEVLRLRATGQAYLTDKVVVREGALVGQLRIASLRIDPGRSMARPVEIAGGVLDFRLRAAEGLVEFGQIALEHEGARITGRGEMVLGEAGIAARLDLEAAELAFTQLVSLWPLDYQPETRAWLAANIDHATLEGTVAALRLASGERNPRFAMTFRFRDLAGRYLPTLPPLTAGRGHGSLTDRRMALMLDHGIVAGPEGGDIVLTSSSFVIPDISVRQAPAEIRLRTASSIRAALSLIDLPPFGFVTAGGLSTDFATGSAALEVAIDLPLKDRLTFGEIDFRVTGKLRSVVAAKLVPGLALTAESLSVAVAAQGLSVSGEGMLGTVPVRGAWAQEFGPDQAGRSRIEARVPLSPQSLAAFGIDLGPETVSGTAEAGVTVALQRGQPPRLSLVSDLARLAISVPGLGLRKPSATTGRLEVQALIATPVAVESFALSFPGLEAKGSMTLREEGGLERGRFERVRIGGWLDVPLELRGAQDGTIDVALLGGRLDMRKLETGSSGSGGGAGGGAVPFVALQLGEVIVTDTIRLTDLSGRIERGSGLRGGFTARVNGSAPVRGTLAPQSGGTGLRIQSDDAGAVMRAARLLENAFGGTLDMVLLPGSGGQRGALRASNVRVRNAPALAELLSLVSVVGLIERLGGEGILFSDIDAQFRLLPAGLELLQASAVGPSLGLTMEGIYRTSVREVAFQGVVTPIYAANAMMGESGVFPGLFGRRREGLFGFTYTLKGPVDRPAVAVNPLSILTPGLFREIFRRPPPTLGQ